MGGEEKERGEVAVKNLGTGEQRGVALDVLEAYARGE